MIGERVVQELSVTRKQLRAQALGVDQKHLVERVAVRER